MKIQTKIVDSIEEAYSQINGHVIDLDEGVEYLMNFNSKSVSLAKKFKKMTAKFNGSNPSAQKKKAKKFAIDNLYATFESEFLIKFYPNKEYEVLDKDVIATYILGCFIEGNATVKDIDVDKQFKLLVIELTNNIYRGLAELSQNSQKTSN